MNAPTSQAADPKLRKGQTGFNRWTALLLVLLPVLQALNLALLQNKEGRKFLSDLFQALAAIIVAAATIRAARKLRQEGNGAGSGWSIIAVAMCFWAMGMLLFMFVEVVLAKPDPYPGFPDVFFLLFYPTMIFGLWRLPREPVSRREVWNNALDVAAMAVVGLLVIWQFNLRLILDNLGAERNAGTWVSLGYTLVDTFLLLMIFSMLVRKLGQGRQFVPLLLLVIGCFFQITADLFQGYVTTKTNFSSGSPIDLGWVLFSTFAGFAALSLLKRGEEVAADSQAGAQLEVFRTGWTLAVTYLWIAMVVVLLIWAVFHREEVHAGLLVVGVVAAALLAITRQVRTLRENAGLYFGLQQAAAELETKVRERTAELERQRALLAESERRTRAIFDLSFGFIGLLDLRGTLLDANQSALQFAGAALSEVVGRPFWNTPWWRHSPEMRGRLQAAVQAAAAGEVVRFEATNAGASGEIRTVDFSLKPLLDEGGKVVLLIPEGRDITERQQAEAILRDSEARAQAQRAAIARLVVDEAVASAAMPEALRRITAILAVTLKVERASVWRLADDAPELRCLALFEAGQKVHSGGAVLKTEDFPRYFEAVLAESRIAAHDAQSDPRTQDLAAGYLTPLGITSMLDAGIQIEGKLAGVVCVEHIGPARRWHPDEEAFASTVAALVAQLFANTERQRAELALRTSEERLRAIVEGTPYLFFYTQDAQANVTYVSPTVERITGYAPEAWLRTRDWFVTESPLNQVARQRTRAHLRGEVIDEPFQVEVRHAAGHSILLEVYENPLLREGQIVGLQGVAHDITQRKESEVALQASQERLRLALDVTGAGVWEVDLRSGRVTVDERALRGLGYEPGEAPVSMEEWGQLHHPEDRDCARAAFARLVNGQAEVYECQHRTRRADGSWAWSDSRGRVIEHDREGRPVRVIGTHLDITERKQAEQVIQRLSQLGRQLGAANNATTAAQAVADVADDLIGWDACFLKLRSPDKADATYVLSMDLIDGKRQNVGLGVGREITVIEQRVMDHGPQLILRENPNEEERFVMFGDQSRPAASLLYVPLRHHGRYLGLFSIHSYRRQAYTRAHLDLLQMLADYAAGALERIRAETALSQSERQFRELFERSPDAVFVEDACGLILDANPAACRLHGCERDALVGKYVLDTVPPESREIVSRKFPQWMTGELTQDEGLSLTADGRTVPVELRGALMQYGGQPALLLHVRDITERKQAEERIRQQAALLDASHDAILVWDVNQGVQFMNPAAEALTGTRFGEVRPRDLVAVLRPKSTIALEAAIRAVESRGAWNGELDLLTGEGKPRIVASRWTVLADAEGKPTSVLITCNDISEKKQLEQQYLRAQRLESVGTLASGVAHDLNNILSPVLMGVELLGMQASDEDTRSILNMMKDSAKRGVDTVKQLLTFARGADAQKGPVQPRHLLKEIARLLQQTFPKNIQIYTDYAGQPATVLADPSQLHQVLMNLCVNARDAMPDGGVLFVKLENQTLDTSGAAIHPKARPIPYVVFKVSDSGAGIPPEILDRIFDPFFTTKPQGKGTGLGLATVIGIVESHGGFVLVDSKLGQGTTFQVFLPASTSAGSGAEEAEKTAVPQGRGELVLVVDDEPAILHLAGEILRHGGYTTLTASNASEALHVYEKQHDHIRAVLTDIMMPFGDGRQLITMLYQQDPQLPIIAMSGLATGEFQRETLKRGARAFIRKPFAADELLKTLAAVLEKKAN